MEVVPAAAALFDDPTWSLAETTGGLERPYELVVPAVVSVELEQRQLGEAGCRQRGHSGGIEEEEEDGEAVAAPVFCTCMCPCCCSCCRT